METSCAKTMPDLWFSGFVFLTDVLLSIVEHLNFVLYASPTVAIKLTSNCLPLFSCQKYNLIVLCNFRYESDGHICNNTIQRSRNRAAIIAISVVVSFLVVAVLLAACLIWRQKRKPNGVHLLVRSFIKFH